jgi:hypothetical protein
MKRIAEFEQILFKRISLIENIDEVDQERIEKCLTQDGQIRYTYESVWDNEIELCTITALYKGNRYYGNGKIRLELTISYE